MINIIYVHGLNSSGNSRTATLLQQYLGPNFKVHLPNIPTDPDKALAIVKNTINRENCLLAVGSSLGGFIVLALRNIDKIVINPCIEPTKELQKLGISENIANLYKRTEDALWNNIDSEERENTYGFFGTHDELFSFRKEFSEHYMPSHTFPMNDGHRISPVNIKNLIVPCILNIFENYKETIHESQRESLNETFETFFEADRKQKLKYLDQVWDVLNKSYARKGGLHGIDSKEELVDDCDVWKLVRRGNIITAAFLYKTKRGGRKICYAGQNGTDQGKKDFYMVVAEDVKLTDRLAWAEGDDQICHIYIDKYGATPIPAVMVKWLFPDKKIEKFDPDGYHYYRRIGVNLDRKMMFGNIGNDPVLKKEMAKLKSEE